MTTISKEKAIEIYALVANDSYACEISSPDGNNCETRPGNGSDMMSAIEADEYSEFYLTDADKDDAVTAYKDIVDAGEISGEGFGEYEYHRLTVSGANVMEVAYIPVGGW